MAQQHHNMGPIILESGLKLWLVDHDQKLRSAVYNIYIYTYTRSIADFLHVYTHIN